MFSLLSDQSQNKAHRKCGRMKKPLSVVKLSHEDWTSECQTAFETLKRDLLHSVTLAHPDFSHSFIRSVEVSAALSAHSGDDVSLLPIASPT